MLPRGTFQCALCEEWYHLSKKKEAFRSHFPERKIPVCENCYDDFRTSPEYEHLRPDVEPHEAREAEDEREYYRDTHIYF